MSRISILLVTSAVRDELASPKKPVRRYRRHSLKDRENLKKVLPTHGEPQYFPGVKISGKMYTKILYFTLYFN